MATSQQVTQLYKELLGRAPDSGGLQHYMGYSNPTAIRSSILGSTEYRNRSAPQPAAAPKPAAPSASQQAETKWLGEGNKLYGELGNFDKTAESPLDMYNKALEGLGIADVRTRVQDSRTAMMNTENLLRNVDANVTQRTSNALVTEAQRQRLVGQERAPLDEALRVHGQVYEGAKEDYGMVLDEGKTQAELKYKGQVDKRQNLIDRLNIAKDNAKTATEKVKWEKEIQLQKEKMAEDKRQFEVQHALEVQKFNLSASQAAKSGGGGGGSRGGGGGGSSSGGGNVDYGKEFLSYISNQFKASGKNPSRQTQDAWANAWFSQNGVKDSKQRQVYWNLLNSTYKRPENPYDDWLYKK